MSLQRLLFLFLLAAVPALLLRLWVFEGVYAASSSMEPTLPVGTHAVLDKVTLRLRAPRPGEIIVFASPVPPPEDMIKRVIAGPGSTVELRGKKVFVDSQPLNERYVRHTRENEKLEGDDLPQLSVPADSFFVLGDNRDESNDSSMWKDPQTGQRVYFVPKAAIRGLLRGFY
ncbi:MAG: signal peptidase I [Elusimicrobiota bacterium]|jgi:signal peptidase I